MIELPEALIIGRQMDGALKGKRIASGDRGNSPHKFAFSNGTSEEYAAIFRGKTVGSTSSHGMAILTEIGQDHRLVLGGGYRYGIPPTITWYVNVGYIHLPKIVGSIGQQLIQFARLI